VVVSGLGQRLQVMRSRHVVSVHSRRVHSHPYFVCVFDGPLMTSMLNPVLKGESLFSGIA
jgi:hypothetical protein